MINEKYAQSRSKYPPKHPSRRCYNKVISSDYTKMKVFNSASIYVK